MGLEIRSGLCAADSTSAATTDRTLAPGRDGRRNSREAVLSLRAVDSEGEVLDFLVQSRRNARAAIRLMRKLLKKQGFAPATIVTDKLRSYGTAIRLLALSAQHEQGLRKNNRAENSHQPVRRRERKMQRFKSPASAQRFLAVHATVYNLFNVQRHLVSRRTLRQFRGDAMRQWRQVTTVA